MIDGLFKPVMDRFWERMARGLVFLGVTPNGITWSGLILVALACVGYGLGMPTVFFGLALLLITMLDALDGAVARLTNRCSRYGGYLDAVVDRYQECLILFSLGWMEGLWPEVMVVLSGSLLTSYNKARVAMEQPTNNGAWPDLLERLERMILLCVGLMLTPWVKLPAEWGVSFLSLYLTVFGILTHITAIQRFLRARGRLLQGAENP